MVAVEHDKKKRADEKRKKYRKASQKWLITSMLVMTTVGAVVARFVFKKSIGSTIWWALMAGYVPSYVDQSFLSYGRKWPAVQNLGIWKSLCQYFSAKVVTLEPLDGSKQYIFGAHPHGLGTWNHFVTMTDGVGFLSTVYPGPRRDLAATVLFLIPFLRELLLWLGCVDAGAATANKVLKAGYSTLIYVGGEQEQILTTRGKHLVYIKKRKGFIRLALKYGAEVVPVYVWGENNLYYTFDNKTYKKFQLWVAEKCRIAWPPCWGRPLAPLVPQRHPLTVVMGRALNKDKPPIPSPTKEQVDTLHAAYIAELERLFNETKATYDSKAAVLEIR